MLLLGESMGYYNIFELAVIGAKSVKHALVQVFDQYRPHILIRKNLPDYRPQNLFPMVAGQGVVRGLLIMRKKKGEVGVHW